MMLPTFTTMLVLGVTSDLYITKGPITRRQIMNVSPNAICAPRQHTSTYGLGIGHTTVCGGTQCAVCRQHLGHQAPVVAHIIEEGKA